jgi:ribosomal protein L12E/L44/L45/RPP1/RPP2
VTHTRSRGKPLSAFASPPVSRDIGTIPESNDEEQTDIHIATATATDIDNSNVDSIRIKSVDHLDDDDDDPIAAAFRASAQNINLDDILSNFSQFNMSGEPPAAAAAAAAAIREQTMTKQENDAKAQRLREQYGTSLYTSDVVDCAEPFLSAFGTKLFHPEEGQQALPAAPPNQRACIGHKETIFGLSFSDCGNFLATASQDSTVRIWDAKTNALLSTLEGHNIEYECLRVAW